MQPDPAPYSGAVRTARRLSRVLAGAADRTPRLVYAAAVVPAAVLVIAVVTQPWVAPTDLVRDGQAVAVLRGTPHASHGLVSNIVILAMALAAGAALLGAAAGPSRGDRLRRAVGWGGGISLVLALDDLLLLHESITVTAWMSKLVVLAYGLGFAVFLWRFRVEIVRNLDVGLLAIAMLALGTSALVDAFAAPPTVASVLVEDGAKVLGFAAWCAFLVRGALVALAPSSAPGPTETAAPVRSRIGA
ncbi:MULTISPECIES: hypothetical protein [unclassified Agromyces]|uniref:hypothetical protein n=1 Tax=unclassified Agromyces TaxID=2639701 RepID=UPI003014E49B